MHRITCIALALFIVSADLAAGGPARAVESRLAIITPHWEGIRKEYEAGFKQWLRRVKNVQTEVKIEWLTGAGSSGILRQIDADFKSRKRPTIDIIFGGGLENFLNFKQSKYLQTITVPGTKQIPAELRGIPLKDIDGTWYGSALSAFGIMYNKRVLQREKLPTPKEWADLARPEYRGRVGAADPRHSGSFMMMCEIMLQANGWKRGWEILTGMVANSRTVSQAAGDLPRDLARGELAVAAVIDFYARQVITTSRDGANTMGYVIPEAQTVITPDPIAVLKGAPHPQAALLFVEYVLTDGQKLLMLPKGSKGGPREYTLGRLAMLPSLYSAKEIRVVVGDANPFKITKGLRYDEEKGSARRKIGSDMIGTLLVDNRTELQRAWRKIKPGQSYAELARPPLTESEAFELAKKWDNAAFRNRTLAEWARYARDKYRKLQ